MEKLKIVGMSSEEYNGGRIDSFTIDLPEKSPHHSHIIPLFLELGFPREEVLDKLDVILQEVGYLFIYGNPKIKAHLIVEDESLSIKFDTSINREKINKIVEKYFQFPE
ncbi:MAG: hypothetical protein ABIH65_00780 [Nanoarchaeota archaeon]